MPVFTVRLATLEDSEAIRAIYNYYVEHSTCTYQTEPELAEERLAWLRDRSSRHPATVAEENGNVVGWASLSQWNPRHGYAQTAEAAVYVHHEHLRRGIGKALLLDLIERARAAGLHAIIGATSGEQTASLALQAAVGFEPVGTFRQTGRKFGRWLDVTYMQFLLTGED